MVWRARNIGLISDYGSDYFSESSAESEFSNSEEESGLISDRASRTKVRAPPRYPRPHSHLLRYKDGQRARGNKHARRWENSVFISSLYQLPEEEVKKGYSILPDHSSALSLLHTDEESMQAWHLFTSRPEEEQNKILTSSQRTPGGHPQEKKEAREGRREEETAESCFRKIDRHIRMMLKHKKHLPSGFLQRMEEELTQFFSTDHNLLVVAIHPDTFFRLLVHGLCQYLGLTSTTLHKGGLSVMVLECPKDKFTSPPISLVTYLTHHT